MNLNESIIKIRVALQNSNINKSGKNSFAGFSYYELGDFLPTLNKLMLDNGVNDIISIKDDHACLTLVQGEERETYCIPFKVYDTPLSKSGKPSMQDIQYLGALNTYYKRYLYLNAFGITDGEVIDSMNHKEIVQKEDTLTPEQQIALSIKKELPSKLKLECKDDKLLKDATNAVLKKFRFQNWKALDFSIITEREFLDEFHNQIKELTK